MILAVARLSQSLVGGQTPIESGYLAKHTSTRATGITVLACDCCGHALVAKAIGTTKP